ncbi:MAG: ATP-binding cassette domain-containing protein [Clostridia bacterium]|nr:ATP-binding cassette domain-containing protein [Clostridia bacterium]
MVAVKKSNGTPVVLLPYGLNGYYFRDPDNGKIVRLNRHTEKLLEVDGMCFYKPLPQKKLSIKDLLIFALDQCTVWDWLCYILSIAAASALGMISPIFTKLLFGKVLDSKNLQVLLALAGFMVCYSLSRTFYDVFQSLVNSRIGMKQRTGVQAAVMNRLMSMPVTFFREYSSGEMQRRANYVQDLCSLLIDSLGTTCITSVFSLVYLGQVFHYAPALVVPSMCITLTTVCVSLITTYMQLNFSRKKMRSSAGLSGMTYSMIAGIQKIKLAGAEKRLFARWANKYSEVTSLEYNPPAFLKLNSTISLIISIVGTLVLYRLAATSGISVSDYYAFNSAYGSISGAFFAVASIARTIANIRPTLEMATPIMETVPETADDKEIIRDIRGSISLSNVSFRYEDNMPWVIDNLSLNIKAGEYLAVVGTTGCGKSTLLRLLLGFEMPQKGYIHYDHKDITKVDLKSLRRKIGTVMQDGKLMWGDIFSNLSVAAPKMTIDEAWDLARMASIADDIERMPMGMHTIIAEGQGGISGGQRQRLLIARALAGKPKILFFDEATSALDNITQKKIAEAIDKLKCTRVVIAHRLSTIRHCDRIVVLDKGHIAEQGTYDELIEKGGIFADLVARQRLDVED